MKTINRKTGRVLILLFIVCLPVSFCMGVTSKITRHSSSQDFLKGQAQDVIIGSRGTLQLGRSAETLVKQLDDVWSINAAVVIGDVIYVGTSPNGGVYSYGPAGLKKIYSAKLSSPVGDTNKPDINEPNDANVIKQDYRLANEHIFAMAADVSSRLLVGISGQRCVLCRAEGGQMKTIFEPNEANYIFAITVGKTGDIYIGTGPQGNIYHLDAMGKKGELLYKSPDKNILSLTQGPDGQIYAGSASRGLVYKINPKTGEAAVLYDSEQQEITAMLYLENDLYAAATSAQMIQQETKFAAQPGRPEQDPFAVAAEPGEGNESTTDKGGDGGTKLQIANTKEPGDKQKDEHKAALPRPPRPSQASYIYKITKDGFVTDVFSENEVFFSMAAYGGAILAGTGNDARLFSVEPNTEQTAVIYEDKQSSQITSVVTTGNDIYAGLANPAKLIKLSKTPAAEGTYTSDLIDAGQPAKWGKLQIEADIPKDCDILVSSRSGNVKDINDPSFSEWTQPADVRGPVQLDCPTGRFCQYKLTLRSKDGKTGPVVRQVTVASTVPNLAPRIESITASRLEGAAKAGVFKIGYDAKDDNTDNLIYKIDFRKADRTTWIEIKNDVESASYEWDSKTVEDGRYEIRVIASDERSNTPDTKMTGSRISDIITVDNTGPAIEQHKIEITGKMFTLKMTVADELSAIGKVEYTIDSDANWLGAMPDDSVLDTTSEDFTIVSGKLAAGQHVIALRLADDVGNMTYKSFDVTINDK